MCSISFVGGVLEKHYSLFADVGTDWLPRARVGLCLKCYSLGKGGSELHSFALVPDFMHGCSNSQIVSSLSS